MNADTITTSRLVTLETVLKIAANDIRLLKIKSAAGTIGTAEAAAVVREVMETVNKAAE